MPPEYHERAYWSERFKSETRFEWLATSTLFMAMLEAQLPSLPTEARILHLGSGTSDMHSQLRARGYNNVTNIDFEPLAVERGQDMERQAFGDVRMRYIVGDATQLDCCLLPRDSFDLVIDKSTADAVACAGDNALRMMAEGIRRHLATGAVWISLSFSGSRFQVEDLPFDVEIIAKIPTEKRRATDPDVFHFGYLLRARNDDRKQQR